MLNRGDVTGEGVEGLIEVHFPGVVNSESHLAHERSVFFPGKTQKRFRYVAVERDDLLVADGDTPRHRSNGMARMNLKVTLALCAVQTVYFHYLGALQ